MQPPSVLHLTYCWAVPTERFVAKEIQSLRALDVPLTVIALRRGRGERERIAGSPSEVIYAPCAHSTTAGDLLRATLGGALLLRDALARVPAQSEGRILPPLRFLPRAACFHWAARNHEFDILHVQFAHLALMALPWVSACRTSLVVNCRGWDFYALALWHREWLARIFRAADLLLFRSRAMLERALTLGCSPEKAVVHHSGVDLDLFTFRRPSKRATSSKGIALLSVGRLVEKKGHDDAIRVVRMLRDAGIAARLTIAGDGPLREPLEQEARELGVHDAVYFAGMLSPTALHDLYGKSEMLLVLSKWAKNGDAEGMPNVILEAAGSGLLVVASDHQGIRDFVREGHTGFVCHENDPRSAFTAIRRALAMRGSWDEIASRARRLVRAKYDARLCALRLKEMYWELLNKTRQN